MTHLLQLVLQKLRIKHKCKYCGARTTQPDRKCYKAPGNMISRMAPHQEELNNTYRRIFNELKKAKS